MMPDSRAYSFGARLIRAMAPAVSLLLLAAAAPDTFSREELEALESEKRVAEQKLAALQASGDEAREDIDNVDAELIAAAMESRRREDQAAEAEKSLADLGTRRITAQMRLLEDQQALEDLLAALAASNRRKPPALVISPGKANTAVRRAILMSETTPRLAARTETVRAEIDELNTLERRIRGEKARLDAAEATLALKQVEIERLAAAKRGAFEDLSGDIARLKSQTAELGARADTLRGLLNALESAAPSAPGVKPSLRPRLVAASPGSPRPKPVSPSSRPLGKAALGALQQPVAGSVLHSFGDKLAAGGKAEWVTFAARGEAQVTAPIAGTVEYARPFRSYGMMLILRTSDGYHVILSGMSRIYVTEGQNVATGEPVGRMPDRSDPPPELNMELRLGDTVMNPADWLPRRG
ncbi:peptidoglycan DD-metalloendopeptidase family protein [uncultured Hyphomonas sp.]|uniref:murein hydrolase activator EnvC family protein n=1 Tax=uncultured Hyphomonas sp. TaxID=225298 RepID=UPI002AAB6F7A|nr:peptidoglycan DD-metalloendopeptidase family protein [uncultured Hyphomonas sp.]